MSDTDPTRPAAPIREYLVLSVQHHNAPTSAAGPAALSALVTERLRNGWSLEGGVSAGPNLLYQAVSREARP